MDKLLYGVAYYDEYMPYDRLDQDVEMMKAAGINANSQKIQEEDYIEYIVRIPTVK